MYDKYEYREFWSYCEFFLAHASSGVFLRSFDLIGENNQGRSSNDAYVYEGITRPVLAKNARGIKRFTKEYVNREKLGRIEGIARSLGETLKASLYTEIASRMNGIIARRFAHAATNDDAPEVLLIMASLYYSYYKNKEISGYAIQPCYYTMFYPFLVKSQSGSMKKLTGWQRALMNRFLAQWTNRGKHQPDLRAFFEHKITRKVVSYALASILGFMRDEEEKVRYLFEVVHDLSEEEMQLFQAQIANGLNMTLHKKKRFISRAGNGSPHLKRVGVINRSQMEKVINRVVDEHFDTALDWITQYHLSVSAEKPRPKLAKQFDKTFLEMNRHLWKEIGTLVDTQRRVVFRTRHLLRIIIHYLFETRGIERQFWRKYIPSVERIIDHTYIENKKTLARFNALLGRQLSEYRKARQYQGTDWDGFYEDPKSRAIADRVLGDIVAKAETRFDENVPEIWFTNQVEPGVNDQILFRFFKQSKVPV
ncbi:MAG: hypothetical protein MI863_05740 [Desulfobacterales bacterium]|nr:hypothetical protein [Desulfobacterales bacterium]